ncbi:hypothetical protein BGZ51_001638 [Haplosporangium sp. Z 767]|nr:hypothetical protein BGZ51_001638 [Haplosporangium sp. Z 767]
MYLNFLGHTPLRLMAALIEHSVVLKSFGIDCTRVKVCGTKFGTLAYRSLVRHFPILRELNIKFCLGTTSAMVRHALVSCPELRSFSADFVEARDVLGIAQDQEAE